MFTSFNIFGNAQNPLRERRCIYDEGFSRFEKIMGERNTGPESSERMSYVDIRAARLKEAQKTAKEVADESVDNAFGDRLFSPIVDEEHAKALAKLSYEKFMEGNTENPQLRGVLDKAYAMATGYPGEEDIVKGLQFGLEGTRLVVLNMDPDYLKWALNDVESQIKFQRENKKPNMDIPQHKRETNEAYNKRVALIRQHAAGSAQYNAEYRGKQVEQWEQVRAALIRYKSDYEVSRAVVEQVEKNPQKVNELTEDWIKKYPAKYRQLVINAGMADPTTLEGKEKYLVGMEPGPEAQGMYEYYMNLDMIWKETPGALKYYPKRLKAVDTVTITSRTDDTKTIEVGADDYRAKMVASVEEDTSLLAHAITEYSDYWEDSDQYSALVINAVKTEPHLFWSDWNKSGESTMLQRVFESPQITPEKRAEIIGSIRSVDQLIVLQNMSADSWVDQVESVIGTSDDALFTIAKNDTLMSLIQITNPTVFESIKERVFGAPSDRPDPDSDEDVRDKPADLAKLRAKTIYNAKEPVYSRLFKEIVQDYDASMYGLIEWNDDTFRQAAKSRLHSRSIKSLLKDPAFKKLVPAHKDLTKTWEQYMTVDERIDMELESSTPTGVKELLEGTDFHLEDEANETVLRKGIKLELNDTVLMQRLATLSGHSLEELEHGSLQLIIRQRAGKVQKLEINIVDNKKLKKAIETKLGFYKGQPLSRNLLEASSSSVERLLKRALRQDAKTRKTEPDPDDVE